MTDLDQQPATALILGASHWHTRWHVDSLKRAGIPVVGVSDPDEGATRATSVDTGAEYHADWRAALDAHPEAVPIVLVEHDQAPDVLLEILGRGRPFVLEKPGTVDAAALEPVAAAAVAAGVPNRVMLVNRRNEFWANVRELESAGAAPWQHAHFSVLAGPPDRYRAEGVEWMLDPLRSGGGALRNLGIHAADAVAALVDVESLEVIGAVVNDRLHGSGVDEYSNALLLTPDQRTIQLEIAYSMPNESSSAKEWRLHAPTWSVVERNAELTIATVDGTVRRPATTTADHYRAAAAEAVRGLSAEPTPRMGAHEADVNDLLRAQKLLDRIYRAARD